MVDVLWTNSGKASTAVGTSTIAAATDLLTIAGHGLADGETVTVDTLTGGGSALTADAVYFVRDASTDTFRLTLSLHGPPVDFATDGGADVYRWSPGYDAQELRRSMAVSLFPGVADEFGARPGVRPHSQVPISVSGTTWTQHDLTAVVDGAGSGAYRVAKPEESASLDPADGTNDRIDALDLQVRDDDEDASGFRRARVVYVPGTPASSPVAQAVTANSLRLGTILVPAGGSPAPSVQTLAQWTVAAGGILPVTGTAQLPTAGRYEGMAAWDQAANQLLVNTDGAGTWTPVAGPGAFPTAQTQLETSSVSPVTSTSYTATGGPNCAVVITAGASGIVLLLYAAELDVGTDVVIFVTPEGRAGGTVGSGTVVHAAADSDAIRLKLNGQRSRYGAHAMVTGLTPGSVYNFRLVHRMSSGSGSVLSRRLSAVAVP